MYSLKNIRIGIIGATGAVGIETLKLLSELNHPSDKLFLFASDRSVGKFIDYKNSKVEILKTSEEN